MGGLIIGDAAVSANLVSPMTVVVVAVSALCSLAIPNEEFGAPFRLLKFGFILLGGLGQRYATIAFGALLIAIYTMLGTSLYEHWYQQPMYPGQQGANRGYQQPQQGYYQGQPMQQPPQGYSQQPYQQNYGMPGYPGPNGYQNMYQQPAPAPQPKKPFPVELAVKIALFGVLPLLFVLGVVLANAVLKWMFIVLAAAGFPVGEACAACQYALDADNGLCCGGNRGAGECADRAADGYPQSARLERPASVRRDERSFRRCGRTGAGQR